MSKGLQFQFPGTQKPQRQIIGLRSCEVCGNRASFGYGVSYLHNQEGRWRCFAHRIESDTKERAA